MSQSIALSRMFTWLVWLGLICLIILGVTHVLVGLRLVLGLLIAFVSAIVHSYSIRYMAGNRLYNRYFLLLFLITLAAFIMVTTDHIWVLGFGWLVSNTLLVILMLHKEQWKAARQAAIIAGFNLGIGSLLLLAGIYLLAHNAHSGSIQVIVTSAKFTNPNILFISLFLIVIAAFMQSAQWPFHKWLLSSLNSPTPVSALMHAGLVNGGGILLAVFSPLYLKQPGWMAIIFGIGAVTAIMGTYWKLVQNSIKRMLACSTMAQMGFMMMQCGLGFYSAALVHLCWHGLFKGNLFLSSGSAVQGKPNVFHNKPVDATRFLIVCLIGLLGAWMFSVSGHKPLVKLDTTLILLGFAFMATAQTAYIFVVDKLSGITIFLAAVSSMAVGFLYGIGLWAVKSLLAPSLVDVPQPLNIIHIAFLIIFIVGWAVKILDISHIILPKISGNKIYVWALNSSQPASSTLTMKRKAYA